MITLAIIIILIFIFIYRMKSARTPQKVRKFIYKIIDMNKVDDLQDYVSERYGDLDVRTIYCSSINNRYVLLTIEHETLESKRKGKADE